MRLPLVFTSGSLIAEQLKCQTHHSSIVVNKLNKLSYMMQQKKGMPIARALCS